MIQDIVGNPVLLDSNLLVLHCVGDSEEFASGRFKNARDFDGEDAALLTLILKVSSQFVCMPYVLAESSNLLRQPRKGSEVRLEQLSRFVISSVEGDARMRDVVGQVEFRRLGATDAAILWYLIRKPRTCLLTVDLDLYLCAAGLKLRTVNFNHVRESRADFHI